MKNKKKLILIILLLVSAVWVAIIGCFIKFGILQPLGIEREESVMELPFVVLTDEGLRFMIEMSAQPTEPTQPPTETTVATVPPETTTPPETTVPETTVPPETTEPAPTEPPYIQLDESWFDDALFIGDSRTVGMQSYARLGEADYFTGIGLNVFNVLKHWGSDRDYPEMLLSSLLERNSYGKILISLGLNEAGYPYDNVMAAYQQMIDLIREKQPDTPIILQAVMTVTERKSNEGWVYSIENIAKINEGIKAFADGENIYYIDVNEWIADENGYLPADLSFDGIHLIADGYESWSKWFIDACGYLNIP